MKSILLLLSLLYCHIVFSQNHKGIAFQAVARTSNGVVMPNKLIQIRISILKDTLSEELLYQEKLKNSVRLLGISLNNLNTHQKKFVVYQLKFEF